MSSPGGSGGGGTLSSSLMKKEEANREHAKKTTDMILNKLNDQKYDPDPKLLEEMNWTKEDYSKFLRRWEALKKNAQKGDPNAKSKYERALKSLNLRPNDKLRKNGQNDDRIEGLGVDSAVVKPPAHLLDEFNATLRDLNSAGNN